VHDMKRGQMQTFAGKARSPPPPPPPPPPPRSRANNVKIGRGGIARSSFSRRPSQVNRRRPAPQLRVAATWSLHAWRQEWITVAGATITRPNLLRGRGTGADGRGEPNHPYAA